MRLYLLRDCYSAQVEACALINIRIGYTCAGVAYPRAWQQMRSAAWGWRNWMPRVSVEFATHSGQNDIWTWFCLRVNRRSVTWNRPGPLTNRGLCSATETLGWRWR